MIAEKYGNLHVLKCKTTVIFYSYMCMYVHWFQTCIKWTPSHGPKLHPIYLYCNEYMHLRLDTYILKLGQDGHTCVFLLQNMMLL